MASAVKYTVEEDAGYAGLRLSAEEYFALPDDGRRYELIDGVVVMSPSPTTRHQRVSGIIFAQLFNFVERNSSGAVFYETDVLIRRRTGRDLVYRPEIVFIPTERAATIRGRIRVVPELVVEVVSSDSRSLDRRTKRQDYERAGVLEYWIIDPERREMTFLRLRGGRYEEAACGRAKFASEAVPGFSLSLAPIRRAFEEF